MPSSYDFTFSLAFFAARQDMASKERTEMPLFNIKAKSHGIFWRKLRAFQRQKQTGVDWLQLRFSFFFCPSFVFSVHNFSKFYSKHKGTELKGTTGLVICTCNAVAIQSLAASNSSIDSRTLPKLYLQIQQKKNSHPGIDTETATKNWPSRKKIAGKHKVDVKKRKTSV